jgi:hypothetical protein
MIDPWGLGQANLADNLRPHMQGDRCLSPLCKRQRRPSLIAFVSGNLHLERAPSRALELPRVTSQIQAMPLNANPEKWGVPFSRMQAFVAYATKVRHRALGLNFAATSGSAQARSRTHAGIDLARSGEKDYYSRLMKSENERFTLSNMPRASSWVRWKACEIRDLTLPIIPPSSSLS